MVTIITFIFGGIFTTILLLIGIALGRLIESKKLDDKIEEAKSILAPPAKPISGPVKAITPEEIKLERDKDFIAKMGEIVSEDQMS